ncbi:hypothetical protein IFM89_000027 [Coptis chinensis]|uniref:Uncharacterized protein n=1 Tax=Coptis chinensis TaxID=261450 RepID=A0A835IHU9_9MAGN|nr:hypothetical protein IFM89_000027 [Coptis chinensis]
METQSVTAIFLALCATTLLLGPASRKQNLTSIYVVNATVKGRCLAAIKSVECSFKDTLYWFVDVESALMPSQWYRCLSRVQTRDKIVPVKCTGPQLVSLAPTKDASIGRGFPSAIKTHMESQHDKGEENVAMQNPQGGSSTLNHPTEKRKYDHITHTGQGNTLALNKSSQEGNHNSSMPNTMEDGQVKNPLTRRGPGRPKGGGRIKGCLEKRPGKKKDSSKEMDGKGEKNEAMQIAQGRLLTLNQPMEAILHFIEILFFYAYRCFDI